MAEIFIKTIFGVVIIVVLLIPVVQYFVLVMNILLRDITKAEVRRYYIPYIGAAIWLLDYYKELDNE